MLSRSRLQKKTINIMNTYVLRKFTIHDVRNKVVLITLSTLGKPSLNMQKHWSNHPISKIYLSSKLAKVTVHSKESS